MYYKYFMYIYIVYDTVYTVFVSIRSARKCVLSMEIYFFATKYSWNMPLFVFVPLSSGKKRRIQSVFSLEKRQILETPHLYIISLFFIRSVGLLISPWRILLVIWRHLFPTSLLALIKNRNNSLNTCLTFEVETKKKIKNNPNNIL